MNVDELIAKQEITEVLFAYCRGVDRLDEDLVRGAYHEDAYDNHGYWKGKGWDFAPFVVDRLRKANTATTHAITNILIELDGDVATSESQIMATLCRRGDSATTTRSPAVADVMGARYVDRFSKRNGVWKIDERTVILDWHHVETWGTERAPIAIDEFQWGARDRTDGVYVMQAKGTLVER